MRLNYRNTLDHSSPDYCVACIQCGVDVDRREAKKTLTVDLYLCRCCYLAFTNHRPDVLAELEKINQ